MAENNSSGASFETNAFVMSKSVRQAIAFPHRGLPGKKAFHGYCELGGNTLQEFHFRRAGLIRRHRTETECAEPILAGGERNEYESAEPELGTGAANELRPARFSVEIRKDQRLLVQPNPPGRIRLNRHPKTCDHRIAWLIENMPLHGAAVGRRAVSVRDDRS